MLNRAEQATFDMAKAKLLDAERQAYRKRSCRAFQYSGRHGEQLEIRREELLKFLTFTIRCGRGARVRACISLNLRDTGVKRE